MRVFIVIFIFVLGWGASVASANSSFESVQNEIFTQTQNIYYEETVPVSCKNMLVELLAEVPAASEITLTNKTNFAGSYNEFNNSLTLSCNQSPKKFKETFYHELGHSIYYDLSANKKSVFEQSVEKYTKKLPNFVTEYASTSPSEDFAETFMVCKLDKVFCKNKSGKSKLLNRKIAVAVEY